MHSGGWDTNGVSVVNVSNDTVTCASLHLTSFAVLVDVAGSQQVCTHHKKLTILYLPT